MDDPTRAARQEEASPRDREWFRPPTRREHRIAAALFVGFGLFFVALFLVTAGFWFRWVVLTLGLYSILHGVRHARDAQRVPDADRKSQL
jgi:hypothetical protein